jgi:spermidine synthase
LAALPLAISDHAWALAGVGLGLAATAAAGAHALAPDRGGTVSAVETRNYSPIYRTREDLYKNSYEPSVEGFELRDRRDTRYHHLLVMDSDGVRYLRFDSSFQSAMRLSRPYEAYFGYTNALGVALGYRSSARDMLFVGLGGGSAPKRMHRDFPELRMRVVEIDPEVVEVARKWFAFPRSIPVDVEDGRRYLERSDERYDVIVIDAYYADSVPFHLTTREFLQTVRRRLKPGGVVVSNVIGAIAGDGSKLLRSFVRTYRDVFPTVALHPVYAGARTRSPPPTSSSSRRPAPHLV